MSEVSAFTCAEPYGGLCNDCAQLGACTQRAAHYVRVGPFTPQPATMTTTSTAPETWPPFLGGYVEHALANGASVSCNMAGCKGNCGICTPRALPPQHDPVNHPSHYTSGAVECIDAIASALGDAFPAYCRGQAIKYLWRAGLKGDALEDARKAAWYVSRLVTELEGGA